MAAKKTKEPKRLIDAERLSDLLTLLETFRNEQHLSLGEMEFLMRTDADIMRKMSRQHIHMNKILKEIREKDESLSHSIS